MNEQDIRWEQRLGNYNKALAKLSIAVEKINKDFSTDIDGNIDEDDFLNDIIKEGVIQRFEYTHELAWKVMKDFLEHRGGVQLFGSKDATREAFAAELITDGELWMEMIKSRNETSHTYNEKTADDIFDKVINGYHDAFVAFQKKMEGFRSGSQSQMFS